MNNTERVDTKLFDNDHYLGKPAGDQDKIVQRRVELLYEQPGFFHKEHDCIEIGCGGGATINQVAHHFRNCLGVDIYDYSGEFEKQKKYWGATNTNFRLLNLEVEKPEQQFQRIISFEVIEHFKDEDTVQKYYELLEPGGLAAISVPNKWWIFETHGARLPLLPWNRVPFFSWLPRFLHERWANARIYTRKRISRLLEKHGFEVVYCCYITAPMDVLREGRLKRFLTRTIFRNNKTSIPILSTSIFVLAKKPGGTA